MNLGEKIKEARKREGLSQIEAAEKSKISVNSLRLYESNRRQPRVETLQNIASALGISVFELMDPEKCIDDFKKGVSEPIDIQNSDIQKALRRYIKDGKLEFPGLAEGSALDAENRENELLYHFRNLNERGQQVAVERVEELTKIPENQKNKNA